MKALISEPTDWETAAKALPYIGYDIPVVHNIGADEKVIAFGVELKEFGGVKVLIVFNQTRRRLQLLACGTCQKEEMPQLQERILEIAEQAQRKLLPGVPGIAQGILRATEKEEPEVPKVAIA